MTRKTGQENGQLKTMPSHNILDEAMGIEINMDDITGTDYARPKHIIDSDNMSAVTFGLTTPRQTQPAPLPEDSDQESNGAVASTASGSNGQGHE